MPHPPRAVELLPCDSEEAGECPGSQSDDGGAPPGGVIRRAGLLSLHVGRVFLPGLLLALAFQLFVNGGAPGIERVDFNEKGVTDKNILNSLSKAATNAGTAVQKHVQKQAAMVAGQMANATESGKKMYKKGKNKAHTTMDTLTIRKDIKDLRKCFNDLDHRWHIFHTNGIFGFTARNLDKPFELADKLYDRYIAEARRNVDDFIEKYSNAKQPRVMNDKGEISITPIIRLVMERFNELASMDGFAPLGCITKYIISPAFDHHIDKLRHVLQSVTSKISSLWNELVRPLKQKMVHAFKGWFNQDGDTEKLAQSGSEKKIEEKADAECAKRWDAFEEAVIEQDDDSLFCVAAAEGIMVFYETQRDWMVENFLKPHLEQLKTAIVTQSTAALHGMDAVAGVIPEVGAALAAILTTAASMLTVNMAEDFPEYALATFKEQLDAVARAATEPIKACPPFMRDLWRSLMKGEEGADVDVSLTGAMMDKAYELGIPTVFDPILHDIATKIQTVVLKTVGKKFIKCKAMMDMFGKKDA